MLRSRSCSPAMAQNLKSVSPEHLPDLINVLIEELVRRRYELPPLATLQRIATQARNDFNEAIYGAIAGAPLRRNPPTLQTRMLSTGKPALGLCRTEKIMSGDGLSSSAPQPVIFGRSRKLNRVARHNQEGDNAATNAA